MNKQRKFRNKEERETVCRGIVEEALRNGIMLESESIKELFTILDKYTAETNGMTHHGFINSPEIRQDSAIEYFLPGRRILHPYVRLTSKK